MPTIREYAEALAADAPPLTPEQVEAAARILGGVDTEEAAA